MDLMCAHRGLWGQILDVQGTIYAVQTGGLVKDVQESHAERLLAGAGWSRVVDESEAPAPKTEAKPSNLRALVEAARSLGISVLGKSSEQLARAIEVANAEIAAAAEAAAAAKSKQSPVSEDAGVEESKPLDSTDAE